jgi:hypothetical protein
MSDYLKYRVLPDEPNYETVAVSEKERKEVRGLGGAGGCAVWGVLWFPIYFGIGFAAMFLLSPLSRDNADYIIWSAMAGAAVVAAVVVALLSSWLKSRNVSILESTRAEQAKGAYASSIKRAENEAKSLTSRLISTYESSTESVAELREHLNQASRLLENAENEYRANAFAPFWDAVENAAQHLSAFNGKTNKLSQNASDYYSKLNGRKHTFPTFPVQIGTIPDASAVVKEFRRVVRMGQTNHDFADIWELRRIQTGLITGFRTLGEAVNNLGATLENSIYNLQETVSSDLGKVIEEQIKTRESFDIRDGRTAT